MTRVIKYGLIGIGVLLVSGFLIFNFTIDSIVKSNIESIGTEMTGTPVTVDGVSISPFSGRGTITGFRVANPDGYSREHALTVDDFFIELDIFSLWSDEIIVREIQITNAALYVEQKLPENNLRTIMNYMNEVIESDPGSYESMVIDHFLMQDGTADLYTEVGGERSARVEMSTIEIHDLGRGGKQYADEVIREIAGRIAEQALQAATRSGTEQLKDAIQDIFQ